MSTFKAYFKKEIMESIRQYRYIVLGAGIIAFAILDPFMLKILPLIIKSQLPVDITAIFVTTPKFAMNNYIKDLVQLGNLFIIFILGGILSDEVASEKLVFPYSMGSKPWEIVLAKIVHYILAVILFTFIGFLLCYYYSGILFEGEKVDFTGIIASSVLMSIYFSFTISLVTLFSSFVKKGITAGFIVMFINFIIMGLGSVKSLGKFLPYRLVDAANVFSFNDTLSSILFVMISSIIFITLCIYKMNKTEI